MALRSFSDVAPPKLERTFLPFRILFFEMFPFCSVSGVVSR